MKDHPPETTDKSFERLIKAEVDSALARLRTGNFEADVQRRIRERTGRKGGLPRLRAFPAWAWMATAVIVFAGLLILVTHPRTTPPRGLAVVIENVLSQAPGSRAPEREWSEPRRGAAEFSAPINGQIVTALMRARQGAASVPRTDKAQVANGKGQRPRPMTLEEVYRILFIDRSIERVLALTS
jgi:hypothetical protein